MDEIVLIIVGMALVTYIPRALPMIYPLSSDLKFLKFVPVSLFAALVFPELLLDKNLNPVFDGETLAGLVALVIAWKSRNIILTMVAGVLVLYLVKVVF